MNFSDIERAKAQIRQEINAKQKQIALLDNLDVNKKISEKEYHEYCDAGLNCSDILGYMLENTLPFLKFKENKINYYLFSTKDQIDIIISNTKTPECVIVLKEKYIRKENLEHIMSNNLIVGMLKTQIAKDKKFLQCSTVAEKAQCLFPGVKFGCIEYIIERLFINYPKNAKNRLKQNVAELNKCINEIKNKVSKNNKENCKQVALLKEYVDMLSQWSSHIVITCEQKDITEEIING